MQSNGIGTKRFIHYTNKSMSGGRHLYLGMCSYVNTAHQTN